MFKQYFLFYNLEKSKFFNHKSVPALTYDFFFFFNYFFEFEFSTLYKFFKKVETRYHISDLCSKSYLKIPLYVFKIKNIKIIKYLFLINCIQFLKNRFIKLEFLIKFNIHCLINRKNLLSIRPPENFLKKQLKNAKLFFGEICDPYIKSALPFTLSKFSSFVRLGLKVDEKLLIKN